MNTKIKCTCRHAVGFVSCFQQKIDPTTKRCRNVTRKKLLKIISRENEALKSDIATRVIALNTIVHGAKSFLKKIPRNDVSAGESLQGNI